MTRLGKLLLGAAGVGVIALGAPAIGQSAADIAALEALRPDPGEYRTTGELVSFDVPGIPAGMQGMVKGMMGQAFAQSQTQCITDEMSMQDQLAEMAKSDCALTDLDVNGNAFTMSMSCKMDDGISGSMVMSGVTNGNSSDIDMDMRMQHPQMGPMNMRIAMTSERIGACG